MDSESKIDQSTNVFLCTSSCIKTSVVEDLFKTISVLRKRPYIVVPVKMSYGTPDQPINEGTAIACFARIVETKKKLDKEKALTRGDLIIALESGIYVFADSESCYDICVLMVYDTNNNTIRRYNSFGIMIDRTMFKMCIDKEFNPDNEEHYLYWNVLENNQGPIQSAQTTTLGFENSSDEIELLDFEFKQYINSYKKIVSLKKDELIGYSKTFGNFLQRFFKLQPDNWMADPRFGNIDRRQQIKDCLEKFMIDDFTDMIPDYPKPGVMFKHMTSITVNPTLLNTMYDLLERMIHSNFDVDQIDYFAGLDARGFYFAPVLAKIFKKGFIPVRKAKKIPRSDTYKIATQSYGTEYSEDEFGLEYRDEFMVEAGKPKKNVLILDDLLATGGSLIGASSVLQKVGLTVVGAVTVYDVPVLREVAKERLNAQGIRYKVLINNDNVPNDFGKLGYLIPEIIYQRIKFDIMKKKRNLVSQRIYTLTPKQWTEFDGKTQEQILQIDQNKMAVMTLIYTEKDADLASKIMSVMNSQMGINISFNKEYKPITTGIFSNGETSIKINANIRGKHVVIVSQIRTGHVNNDYMELLLILDACSRSSADKLTVVMPYYPYSRSDKKDDPRSPIAAAMVSNMLNKMHVDNLVSVDLHAGQIQGYMDKGFHNLYIKRYMCEFIHKNYLRFYDKSEWNNLFILIAPDAGSARAVKGYSSLLGINNIILDKQRDYSRPGTVTGSRFIGSKDDFKGKTGFIIDDMADTMGTMCSAAKELVENGMKDVVVFVTHGVLSGPAIEKINQTPHIKEVVVSDTLPQDHNVARCPKLKVLSTAELLARVVHGILTGRSISRLF